MNFESDKKICKRCGRVIFGNLLSCPDCLLKVQRDASLHIQRRYLAAVIENRLSLMTGGAQPADSFQHIQFFENPGHAYCGVPLNNGKRQCVRFNVIAHAEHICSRCIATLDELINEAKSCHSD